MKKLIICFLILLSNLTSGQNKKCPEGINNLPMYGEVTKCDQQIQIDNDFLKECDTLFKNRKLAAIHHVNLAWGYFYKNQVNLSMRRFNQAWLLDKDNADVYWGYGNLLGKKSEFENSIKYFEKSIKIESSNAKVWESIATSYSQLFFKTKETQYLNKTIKALKISIKIEPNNARAYGQLTGVYSYFKQKDSLRKYIKITDRLDSNAVHPEVRKLLKTASEK